MSEQCRNCGADLDRYPPFEVHASVAGEGFEGMVDADLKDPGDTVLECSVCETPYPTAIEADNSGK